MEQQQQQAQQQPQQRPRVTSVPRIAFNLSRKMPEPTMEGLSPRFPKDGTAQSSTTGTMSPRFLFDPHVQGVVTSVTSPRVSATSGISPRLGGMMVSGGVGGASGSSGNSAGPSTPASMSPGMSGMTPMSNSPMSPRVLSSAMSTPGISPRYVVEHPGLSMPSMHSANTSHTASTSSILSSATTASPLDSPRVSAGGWQIPGNPHSPVPSPRSQGSSYSTLSLPSPRTSGAPPSAVVSPSGSSAMLGSEQSPTHSPVRAGFGGYGPMSPGLGTMGGGGGGMGAGFGGGMGAASGPASMGMMMAPGGNSGAASGPASMGMMGAATGPGSPGGMGGAIGPAGWEFIPMQPEPPQTRKTRQKKPWDQCVSQWKATPQNPR